MHRDAVVREAQRVLAHHARTFHLASLLLEPDCRDDVAIVYAFCRLVDDTVDEAADPQHALTAIKTLQRQLEGEDPTPLIAAFSGICDRYGIPRSAPRELIYGVGSDVGPVRVQNDEELLRYSYRVAGTVGLMMSPLIKVTAPHARFHAIDLGIAMQLTNICRDVLEDAQRDRVYLPASRLREAGTSQEALLQGCADPEAVSLVVRQLLALAEDYYASGEAGLRYIPTRPRAAIAAAARMYRAIGLQLLERGADPLQGRTIVPLEDKLLWLLRGLVAALIQPWTPAQPHPHHLHEPLSGLPAVATPPAA